MHEDRINEYIEGKYGKLGVDRYGIFYSSLKNYSALGTCASCFYIKNCNVVSHVKLEGCESLS